MHGVFIGQSLLEDMAQLQPWPHSLAYSYEVKDIHVGLNLCSKTVSWVDVRFAYSGTATDLTLGYVDILSDGLLAGWLAGHLTKYHLCIDVTDGQPQDLT